MGWGKAQAMAFGATSARVLGCLWVFSLASCDVGTGPSDPAPAADEVTFEALHVGRDATAGLVGRERLEALAPELARSGVDVLCLEGLGRPEDRARLKAAIGKSFPHSLDLPTTEDSPVDDPRDSSGVVPPAPTQPPCAGSAREVASVGACLVASRCAPSSDAPVDDVRCLDGCTSQSPDPDPTRRCYGCAFSLLRTGATLAETASRCSSVPRPLAMNGEHGMILLSRLPLSRASLHVLPSEGTRRAVVGAVVTTPKGAEVQVFCASLGPTQASALPTDPDAAQPYFGPYGSPREGWLRENELQIEKLAAHVATQRGSRPAIVLGNFGASAEVVRSGVVVVPVAGKIGAARLAALFTLGVAPDATPGCTMCLDNPLVDGATIPSFQNPIYLLGLPRSAVRESSRSYLGEVVGFPPNNVRAPLSMQYGFRARIAIPIARP